MGNRLNGSIKNGRRNGKYVDEVGINCCYAIEGSNMIFQ